MSREQDTPLGVWIVAFLGAIGSFLGVVAGLGLLEAAVSAQPNNAVVGGLSLVVIALSLGQLVVVYGLVKLTRWGYRWAMVLYGLTFVVSIASLVLGNASGALRLLVSGTVLLYLYGRRTLFLEDGGRPARSADSIPSSSGRRGR